MDASARPARDVCIIVHIKVNIKIQTSQTLSFRLVLLRVFLPVWMTILVGVTGYVISSAATGTHNINLQVAIPIR